MSEGVYYAIRHKATGELMPALDRNRGYSHWNPSGGISKVINKKILEVPRLLKSLRQTRQVINQWNALPNAMNTFDRDGECRVDIKPDGRKKEDLEVVVVDIRILDGGKE